MIPGSVFIHQFEWCRSRRDMSLELPLMLVLSVSRPTLTHV